MQDLHHFIFWDKELEDLLWTKLPRFSSRIGDYLNKQWQLKSAVYRDIQIQFQESPLCFSRTILSSEKECRNIFPRLNHALGEDNIKLNQQAWVGLQDFDVISTLKEMHSPIRISVHTMMVAVIVTLLSLEFRRGIRIDIDWQSGASPEQLSRVSNSPETYHFLFTADAGMNYTENRILFDYSRLFTCVEETQYIIGKSQTQESASLVYITPGTTQQIQYELWRNENRLPKDRIELASISDTPHVVENLASKEVFILTRQKSRRFLKKYPLSIIGKERRGLSFSLYYHNISWIDQQLQLQQFIRAFITEWNFCRNAFLGGRLAESGLQNILNHMWCCNTFLDAYSIASDFELFPRRNF